MEKALYLVLENGQLFCGKSFGACRDVEGEIVFTTAMTGYLETLTDPSYYGQIVVQTFPLIGNYGIIPEDFEAPAPVLRAYIVRDWCEEPSNYRCQGNLDTFLAERDIVGLYGIDTRELTKIIREHGVMNAKITSDASDAAAAVLDAKNYVIRDAVRSVSCKESFTECAGQAKYRIVLWDFGAKANIRRELVNRGCEVITVPSDTTADQIAALSPDGIMLSNGPGDPADNTAIIAELAKLCEKKIPTFGICLGHQLLALSQGAKTAKLKYGHRGSNQPVRNTATGRVYITSQNHGYAVLSDTLPANAVESYVNANDGTCEGVRYTDMPVFTVQFHPEAHGGPLDTSFLFDEFLNMIGGAHHA